MVEAPPPTRKPPSFGRRQPGTYGASQAAACSIRSSWARQYVACGQYKAGKRHDWRASGERLRHLSSHTALSGAK